MRWERVRQQNQQEGLGDSSSGPGKRWGHSCNAIKGGRFVYVFGGFGRDDCLTNQVHVFDAETQVWTKPVISGVPPSPRDSHSCTTVGDNLFVFGGTDGKTHLKDLHVLDTSSHTWKCVDVRGEGPEAREAHSATLVGKRIFIFGGCGKASGSDDEVFYNDLYILNTETLMWQRAVTAGNPPSARDSHTCSTWKNKIIVVGGEDLDDYFLSDVHILDTETFVWKQMKTSGQVLTPRAGHVTVALERNLFVFGGFTDSQNLYDDLNVLDVETGVWSKVAAIEEGPSARFCAGAVCLGPYKAGSVFFLGGCNKNLEPLDDIYYLHTDVGYRARFDQTPGRLSLRKQMKLKCQQQQLAAAGTSTGQGRENLPLSIGSIDQRKTVFHARVTENVPLGYSIETIIDGKMLRGFLFSNRHSSVQTADPSVSCGKRPAMMDLDCDHRAKSQRTLSEDAAGSGQQAGPVDPSDDANKKVADSSDMETPMIDTADANVNITRPQEAGTAAVASDVKDQDSSQLNMDTVNAEPSPVTVQANVEPSRDETLTDAGAATEAGPGGDSSPQNQDEGTVAAEDAEADQKPQPH
ncbi:Galactose oxidase/kelch repeat superfamily protein [Raphanus sativus]|nr:Galactose oxidase/kelch repeat superfamily protein [Raphanus sativus]